MLRRRLMSNFRSKLTLASPKQIYFPSVSSPRQWLLAIPANCASKRISPSVCGITGETQQLIGPQHTVLPPTELQDTDSDDVYESHCKSRHRPYPESSTLNFAVREAYPAWSSERQIPLSKEEIEDVFLNLTYKFGFQRDLTRNMVHYLLSVRLLSGNLLAVLLFVLSNDQITNLILPNSSTS